MLLAKLEASGVRVALDGGRLVVRGREVSPETRAWLSANRAALLAELLSPEAFEVWAERAAIVEHDGGLDRHAAERAALDALRHETGPESPAAPLRAVSGSLGRPSRGWRRSLPTHD